MSGFRSLTVAALALAAGPAPGATTEFCIDGEFDLGARMQGLRPEAGEFYTARWCVITEDDSERVLLSMSGQSNPDMSGGWSVAFLPPDLVRIVNAESPPDIEFRTPKAAAEARRARRMDPRRLVEELGGSSGGDGFSATVAAGRLESIETSADLPLRGRVPVAWHWDWANPEQPTVRLVVDDVVFLRGTGRWRAIDPPASLWEATPGAEPVAVPGENWPARVNMGLTTLADGVYLVTTVRTGFQHLVVDTDEGLVVADAPAGWVELHQIPPEDLVPGLGVSGLSEGLIAFLAAEFPGRPLRAVALTHHHDDHAGGARAFAAAGATVYAPDDVADFLAHALNRDDMPADRLAVDGGRVEIIPVGNALVLEDDRRPVELMSAGSGPHAAASLGVHVPAQGFFFQSDLHVPNSESDVPREDRVETECWFASWALANLPDDTVIINTHSAFRTPLSRLERYAESPACSGAAGES